MGGKIYLLLLLFVSGPVASVPLSPSLQLSIPDIKEDDNPMDVQKDDMLIRSDRSATTCTQCLWPKSADGTVTLPYAYGSNYSDWQLTLFQTSMEEYESLTCLRFVPRTTQSDYLNIVSGRGCVAYVGRIGGGQMLGVDAGGCMYRGIIQHEINHALGFFHEQMRSDRDNYVTIMYQNIAEGASGNFAKVDTNNLGLEYDYASVMHYNMYEFSNGLGPTIVPIPDPNVPIGQRDGLSVLDVAKINRLYGCNVCGNILGNNNGSLTSANYPSAYPNNAGCVWLIRTPSGQAALNFVAFDVQSSPNCMSDYIRIYDGPTKQYPLVLDRTCGTGLIPPIIASTNQLLLEFTSDSSGAGTGFKALYSSVQCGGTFYTPGRNFTSPGYPNSYPPNLNCTFTITAPVGRRIVLTVSDFETQYARFCPFDYLWMMDGPQQKGPFCGPTTIPIITTKTNSLKVMFVTNEMIQMRGFAASYVFI